MGQKKKAETKIVKKLPANELSILQYKCFDGTIYKITKNQITGIYTIYKAVPDGFERLGAGNNPTVLEEKHIEERKRKKDSSK